MNDPLMLTLTFLTGALLGLFFFGGLWWTIQKGMYSKTPALWFLGSIILRTTVVLAGFFYISGGEWQRILTCLLGFVLARSVLVRLRQAGALPSMGHETKEP
ncbi:MAG: hypothetical protein KDC32_05765 [Saprospiraceae bacterium]|nr:hypothetical protein [Saprospiraceae bacterium]MCB0680440.1 hypothetical protein [Saprospiraceae bacterium]